MFDIIYSVERNRVIYESREQIFASKSLIRVGDENSRAHLEVYFFLFLLSF